MSLPEWLDFGKWTPFILWCYAISTVVIIINVILAYRKEKRLLREIAQKVRRESRGIQ